jgi:hypothetical protein
VIFPPDILVFPIVHPPKFPVGADKAPPKVASPSIFIVNFGDPDFAPTIPYAVIATPEPPVNVPEESQVIVPAFTPPATPPA